MKEQILDYLTIFDFSVYFLKESKQKSTCSKSEHALLLIFENKFS